MIPIWLLGPRCAPEKRRIMVDAVPRQGEFVRFDRRWWIVERVLHVPGGPEDNSPGVWTVTRLFVKEWSGEIKPGTPAPTWTHPSPCTTIVEESAAGERRCGTMTTLRCAKCGTPTCGGCGFDVDGEHCCAGDTPPRAR